MGKNENKISRITIRLAPRELARIQEKCKQSTCRKLSEYIRLVLLGKPVKILTRDQSADEMIAELTRVRGELNRIGSNSNQATKRLHSLSQIAEFRTYLQHQEQDNQQLLDTVNQVKSLINKLADRWLR